eukprot:SAG11_NODE_3138_length_2659_cov_2.355469_1_plen_365_part_00
MAFATTTALLGIVSFAPLSSSTYDPALAGTLLLVSDAAYCGDSAHGGTASIVDWSCPPCMEASASATSGVRLDGVRTFENDTQQTFGFAGRLGKQTVLVALRGSVLPQNFVDDHDQALVPAAGPEGRIRWAGAGVHEGMYRSYRSIEQPMMAAVAALLRSAPAETAMTILVSGHSLGAGQAVYASAVIAGAYPQHRVLLYSFGTPRPGSRAFAEVLNNTLPNLEAFAVAHRADTVPQCGIYPAPCGELQKGLHQIKTNVWYPADLVAPGAHLQPGQPPLGGWIKCDGSGEDPRCQDSLLKEPKLLNWNDHNIYFNHSMYCCDRVGRGGKPPHCKFPFPTAGMGSRRELADDDSGVANGKYHPNE